MTAVLLDSKHPEGPAVEAPVDSSNQQAPTGNPPEYKAFNNQDPFVDQDPETLPPLERKLTFGERFHKASSKAGRPVNRAANLVGAEGFFPDSVEKESMKAARILYSFTKLGIERPPRSHGPKHPTGITRKSMVKIPTDVLRNCRGLAIFNTIRGGFWHGSLAGGSGVVVARRPDGTWSPPSSFVISTVGGGLMFGLDVYDCVCVLNTQAQVDAFTYPRVSLGGSASVSVGPVGTGGSVNSAASKTGRPMWSYIKSRGLWLGVQIDGTVIVTRGDANSVFYNEHGITAKKILHGDVAWPVGAKPLFEVLKALEGRPDIDQAIVDQVSSAPPPGDSATYQGDAPGSPVTTGVEDEKQGPTSQTTEVARNDTGQDAESDLYDNSVMGEKERLARSGY